MLIHNADITGSLLVNGTRFNTGSFSGSFTGIVAGTTATASYVEYNNVANKPALVSGSSQITYSGLTGIPSGIVSGSSQVTYSGLTGIPSGIVSGSSQVTYSGLTGIPSGILSGSAQIAAFGYATTGSNQFNGNQAITGSLTTTGQIVAQTLNVQQVTSSIVYSSGSNIFGNSVSNTQQLTGSVGVTGSLTVTTNGVELQVTNTGVNLGNALTDSHIISGSLRVNPNGLFVSGSGNVGIGTTSPSFQLDLGGSTTNNTRLRLQRGSDDTAQNALYGWNSITIQRTNVSLSSAQTDFSIIQQGSDGSRTPFYISSGGNVGIGTTSPVQKLHVEGSAAIGTTGTEDILLLGRALSGGVSFQQAASLKLGRYQNAGGLFESYTRLDIALRDNSAASNYNTNTTVMTLTNAGNVGIGTTSPGTTLQVDGSSAELVRFNSTAANGSYLGFRNSLTLNAAIGTGANIISGLTNSDLGLWSTGLIAFLASGSERMRITSGGNVGIGTTSPDARFHVALANAGGVGGQVVIDNPASSTLGNTVEISFLTDAGASGAGTRNARILAVNENAGNGAANLQFHTWDGSTSAERMRITSGGEIAVTSANNITFGFSGYGIFLSRAGLGPRASLSTRVNTTWVDIANSSDWSGATICASGGNVLIGTTSDNNSAKLQVNNGAGNALYIDTTVLDGNTRDAIYLFEDDGQATGRQAISWYNGNQSYYKARLWTQVGSSYAATTFGIDVADDSRTVATRLAIRNGNVGIGTTTPTKRLQVEASVAGEVTNIKNTRDNGNGDYALVTELGTNDNNTNNYHYIAATGGADRMYIYGNGNIVNTNGSYGTLSDISLKENIVDATPKLTDLLQLKVRNFNLIGSEEKQIGFIAQEFEEIFPKMVDIDGKNGMKTIKTSVLVPMLVKAIQELKSELDAAKTEIQLLKQQ